MEIRLLAKNRPENRLKIAKTGAVKPLISLISSSDSQLQEYGVTAIFNLSLYDENKGLIASSKSKNHSSHSKQNQISKLRGSGGAADTGKRDGCGDEDSCSNDDVFVLNFSILSNESSSKKIVYSNQVFPVECGTKDAAGGSNSSSAVQMQWMDLGGLLVAPSCVLC